MPVTDPDSAFEGISVLGFDADDTLWHSESYFVVTEERFRALLAPWCAADEVGSRLLDRERENLRVFGYGIKGFTLSMIETAIEASEGAIPSAAIEQIIRWGKEMLSHPVELLPGVRETLESLRPHYRLALITKGDLFHQESKIAESGLADLFESVDVLAEKDAVSYQRAIDSIGVVASEFCMIGNSVRSDVLPIIELGGRAVHIPYQHTWDHEVVAAPTNGEPTPWIELARIGDLPAALRSP